MNVVLAFLLTSFFTSFKSHVLLSPRGLFTWMEAYNTCKANSGYLASKLSDKFTTNSKNSSLVWTGKVELQSKWLQIIGCYYFNDTSRNIFQVPTIANCEMECSRYRYFTYRAHENPLCVCLSQKPETIAVLHYCDSLETYRYSIVYERYLRSTRFENKTGNCMYSSCVSPSNPLTGPYVINCTSTAIRGVCDDGYPVEDENTGWHKGLSDCIENHGTYFLKDFRRQCSSVKAPSWTNIFRQHYSFQYEIHTHDDEIKNIPLKCGTIELHNSSWPMGNDRMSKTQHTYMDCNTRLPYFICKTDSSHLVTIYPNYPPSTTKNYSYHNISNPNSKPFTTRTHSSHNSLYPTTVPSPTSTHHSHKQSSHSTTIQSTTIKHNSNAPSQTTTPKTSSTKQHYSSESPYPTSIPFNRKKHNALGVIIGGVVAGIIVLLVLVILFICRKRVLRIFRKITNGDHQRFENPSESNIDPYNQTTRDEFSNSNTENYVMRDHELYGRCENKNINKLNDNRSRHPVSFNPLHAQVCVSKQNIP